ncbi:hypothetical protein J6590_046022 [Homalodisca vitripennis]|nr:hypothetical protein J6590_046022 [Homalodisca vitripennis]
MSKRILDDEEIEEYLLFQPIPSGGKSEDDLEQDDDDEDLHYLWIKSTRISLYCRKAGTCIDNVKIIYQQVLSITNW